MHIQDIRHKFEGSILCPSDAEGETIETKVARITTSGEPIKDGAPIIYLERKNGVLPEYDVRTDRFDLAIEGMDYVTRAKLAKREERHKPKEPEKKPDASAGSIQGTDNGNKPAA